MTEFTSAPLPWCISKREKAYYENKFDRHRSGDINLGNFGEGGLRVVVIRAVHVVCCVEVNSNTYTDRQT